MHTINSSHELGNQLWWLYGKTVTVDLIATARDRPSQNFLWRTNSRYNKASYRVWSPETTTNWLPCGEFLQRNHSMTGLVCSVKAMDNSGVKDPWQKVAGSEGWRSCCPLSAGFDDKCSICWLSSAMPTFSSTNLPFCFKISIFVELLWVLSTWWTDGNNSRT